MTKKIINDIGEALIGIPRIMIGLPGVQRRSGKVTLLYSGECNIDETLERASHLKSTRDEINRKYNQQLSCQVGSGGYGFYGADLGMSIDGIFNLSQYFVVNFEAKEDGDKALMPATLDFVSDIPEQVVISLYSHISLEKEIKEALLKTGKYLNQRR